LEIAIPGGSSAAAPGPNGHAGASAHSDKTPIKAAAATAGAADAIWRAMGRGCGRTLP